jgi:hypothetical protein
VYRETALGQLSGDVVHHGGLLVASMKITSYNQRRAAGSAPFFRALVVYRYQVYSEGGADNVIQISRNYLQFKEAMSAWSSKRGAL